MGKNKKKQIVEQQPLKKPELDQTIEPESLKKEKKKQPKMLTYDNLLELKEFVRLQVESFENVQ